MGNIFRIYLPMHIGHMVCTWLGHQKELFSTFADHLSCHSRPNGDNRHKQQACSNTLIYCLATGPNQFRSGRSSRESSFRCIYKPGRSGGSQQSQNTWPSSAVPEPTHCMHDTHQPCQASSMCPLPREKDFWHLHLPYISLGSSDSYSVPRAHKLKPTIKLKKDPFVIRL